MTHPLVAVLAEVGRWGPFFAVDTEPAPDAPWRPLRELVDDPAVLAGRVEDVRAHLTGGGGHVSVRVAASVAHLGITARLVSPALGALVHSGLFPAFGPDDVWWQARLGGAFPLAMSGRASDTADELLALLDGLTAATATFSVSRRVLWGNVASALHGAATVIGRARPDLAARAVAAADSLLALPQLRGTGGRGPDGRFRRHSCCLIYQASPAGRTAVCGDCVLARGPAESIQDTLRQSTHT